MLYPEYIADILSMLHSSGYEAYIVGGSVRDSLLGLTPNDFDITTSALPENIIDVFGDFKLVTTGLKHGTVTVIYDSKPIEITTFRVDGDYLDSRHPSEVYFTDSIVADLSRRDFTVNAMAYDDEHGVIDPFEGKRDLKNKIIRTVGEAERRFGEDALRIMRAFRFSAQLGFDICDSTLIATNTLKDGLSKVSRERISTEFIKLITAKDPRYAMTKMKELGIFEFVLGAHLPSDGEIRALSCAPNTPRARLGILLASCPEEMRPDILADLRLSNKLTSNVLTIAKRLSSRLEGSEVDARRFIGSCGELVEETLECAKALGTLDESFEASVRKNLQKKLCLSIKDLAINGGDLISLGASGKQIGYILDALLEEVTAEPEKNERETLISLAKKHLIQVKDI
ncbi:MAG: CCA tRNA nucleotidyltransferase [Clostridia bacterium]|nr:CCA tRNA nucleotidyltransferase [Clostridia bacterium]